MFCEGLWQVPSTRTAENGIWSLSDWNWNEHQTLASLFGLHFLSVVKFLPPTLLTLIVAIQYPLWFGKGGWLRVWEVEKQVEQQKTKNKELASRNAGLDAEVRDLKAGGDAVEERARVELGMVKPDEVFYQVAEKGKP